ncbi:MAG: hypothetical protein AB7G75_15555 [Candidatus Binatia bacterium]
MNGYSLVVLFLVMRIGAQTAPAFAKGQPVVSVSTVAELYAAVNNSANKGMRVELAPGTYVLDPTKPNGGRLFLQGGMNLMGRNSYVDLDGDGVWDPRDPSSPDVFADPATETILDASNITTASTVGEDAVIFIGHRNRVERVTVKNYGGSTLIGTTLDPAQGGLQAEVIDCIVENSQRGVTLGHFGEALAGLNSRFTLERNIVRQHSVVGAFIFNLISAMDARVHALLHHNRFYNNSIGLSVISGDAADNAEVEVVSQGNIAEQNQLGFYLIGGQDALPIGLPQGGNGGRLRFTSVADAIWNNVGVGGVFAAGAVRRGSLAEPSNDNEVRLQFLGTRFVKGEGSENRFGTSRMDLRVVGGFGGGADPGSGNAVEILIRQAMSDGTEGAFFINAGDCLPEAPNKVTVIGSPVAFAHANDGVDIPPIECFSSPIP